MHIVTVTFAGVHETIDLNSLYDVVESLDLPNCHEGPAVIGCIGVAARPVLFGVAARPAVLLQHICECV